MYDVQQFGRTYKNFQFFFRVLTRRFDIPKFRAFKGVPALGTGVRKHSLRISKILKLKFFSSGRKIILLPYDGKQDYYHDDLRFNAL